MPRCSSNLQVCNPYILHFQTYARPSTYYNALAGFQFIKGAQTSGTNKADFPQSFYFSYKFPDNI